MATLTTNLFWGQGARDHRLDVIDGHWPEDLDGSVYVVGPDKRRPGGHWFSEHGLLERIRLAPDPDGRIRVEHRRVDTPMNRIRRRLPRLFKTVQFLEVSPFGFTNMANTGVQPIGDRLFVGFDGGRPVEVDPETLEYLTPVGGNDEWLQVLPGLLEPLVPVAAHPAADHDASTLYFVNYDQAGVPGEASETHIARWDLEGPVQRWRVEGMSPFDSIHDVKVSEHHVVFSDLPFAVEPGAFRGQPRTRRNQEHTNLWIVAKADLDATAPGGTVRATEVTIPMPTGHLFVDHEEADGKLRVVLQHIPLADLMLTLDRDSVAHGSGRLIDPNYEGLIALSVQPSVIGRYVVDPATGTVTEQEVAVDEERVWGGVLATTDTYSAAARRRQRQLWYAGVGFDPDLVPQSWWDLYGDATDGVVAPGDLPTSPVPASLARFDLESMKVAEVHSYADGAFPSPPTFVPRRGATDPDDGYVVVLVHQDGPKEIQVFDAQHIERGPLARASSPTFNPNLMLHSCWMPDRSGPRRSRYRIPLRRDVRGAIAGLPGVLRSMAATARSMARAARTDA
jgi:all-trans-8'-apo-beta-carotenal 15,15'-oxygenase